MLVVLRTSLRARPDDFSRVHLDVYFTYFTSVLSLLIGLILSQGQKTIDVAFHSQSCVTRVSLTRCENDVSMTVGYDTSATRAELLKPTVGRA